MSIASINPLIKEYLYSISIEIVITEDLTDISDTEDNLEVENDLINELAMQT